MQKKNLEKKVINDFLKSVALLSQIIKFRGVITPQAKSFGNILETNCRQLTPDLIRSIISRCVSPRPVVNLTTLLKNAAKVAHLELLFIMGTLSFPSATSIIVQTFRAS